LKTRIGARRFAGEALELLGGPHGDPDIDLGGVGDADALGVGVVDLHGELGEEQPRVGDRDGQIGSSIDWSHANGDCRRVDRRA
jgi:hypothetical protein